MHNTKVITQLGIVFHEEKAVVGAIESLMSRHVDVEEQEKLGLTTESLIKLVCYRRIQKMSFRRLNEEVLKENELQGFLGIVISNEHKGDLVHVLYEFENFDLDIQFQAEEKFDHLLKAYYRLATPGQQYSSSFEKSKGLYLRLKVKEKAFISTTKERYFHDNFGKKLAR